MTLPCGTALDSLADQVHAGRAQELSDHQRACPHCRPALAELSRVVAPVLALAREPVTTPRSTVDRVEAVLIRGRAPVRLRVDVERGTTDVGDRVVVACARRAAESVPGVRAAIVRVTPDAAIEVVLAAAWGLDLRATGDHVRRVVTDEVVARTGVVPVRVSALVDTVVTE